MRSVLEIERLEAALVGDGGTRLLKGISLTVAEGEVLGLVGMSGTGKSMIAKAVLGVLPAAVRIAAGSIKVLGEEIVGLDRDRMRAGPGRHVALIPQDPLSALNPSRRIGAQLTDVMGTRLGIRGRDAHARALALLGEVRIREPEALLRRYPHELSGGQRQRVLIAVAFAAEPKLIVADEPTTALDVTVQKQILRLIRDLCVRHRTAVLFVTHDLGVVAKICDRVVVMHAGRLLEEGPVAAVLQSPRHPFTRALLEATPRHDRPAQTLRPVPQSVLDAIEGGDRS